MAGQILFKKRSLRLVNEQFNGLPLGQNLTTPDQVS